MKRFVMGSGVRALPGALAAMLMLDRFPFLGGANQLRRFGGVRSAAWYRRTWTHPHQGARERARRQAQVARLAARGRDWTGRPLAGRGLVHG